MIQPHHHAYFLYMLAQQLYQTTISQFASLPQWDMADFFDFMNKKILHELHAWGVTENQEAALSYAANGESNTTIGLRLKISHKTVSMHTMEALIR